MAWRQALRRVLERVLGAENDHQRLVVTLLASIWLLACLIADVVTRRNDVTFVVLFAVAPLIASTAAEWPVVAGFAAAAVTLTLLSPLVDTGLTSNSAAYAVRIVDVVLVSAAAVVIAAVRSARERQLARVTAVAAAAQEALLPSLFDTFEGLRVATRYRSATQAALVGGDFYDAVQLPGRVRVIVGDVRGKGLPSVAHAARAIRAFRLFAGSAPNVASVAHGMSGYLHPFLGDEDFVTAVVVEAEEDGTLHAVSCGHPEPILLTAQGVTTLRAAGAPPLGLPERFGLPVDLTACSATWSVGDRLLLCTDGLTEARAPSGALMPIQRITGALAADDIDTALDALVAAVDEHTGGGTVDDLALLLLERDEPLATGERVARGPGHAVTRDSIANR